MNRYEPRPENPVSIPLDIRLVDGEVVFIGPGAIAFSMTLAAAVETCTRLHQLVVVTDDGFERQI